MRDPRGLAAIRKRSVVGDTVAISRKASSTATAVEVPAVEELIGELERLEAQDAEWRSRRRVQRWRLLGITAAIAAVGFYLRTKGLMAVGFNSDEAVYAGQGASIAGNEVLLPYFPIFRAHPLLFQSAISIPYLILGEVSTYAGRMASVLFGMATLWVIYLAGATLYGRRVGAIAAAILAVMPYHVVVTRQVLLDGPLTFFATASLYLMAKFGKTGQIAWFYASMGAMGLTFLSKEAGILLFGAIYVFVALYGKVKLRNIIVAMAVFVVVVLPYPLSIAFSGRSSTGEQFLSWQLFRRANHSWEFYFVTVPPAVGWLVLLAAVAAVVSLKKKWRWQEILLTSWILVPLAFFQLWPVKGFQYLLPLAPPVVILAARGLAQLRYVAARMWLSPRAQSVTSLTAILVVLGSLAIPSLERVEPSSSTEFLAGSGGVPGGREAGLWVGENVPVGAELLALGPSMANIIQFYGHRKTYGLSVSPNPLHRNPVYEPVNNPDLRIRSNDLQYIIWDSFSASRSPFFSSSLLRYAERYHGRVVHTEFVDVKTDDGAVVQKPVIVIYEVRP